MTTKPNASLVGGLGALASKNNVGSTDIVDGSVTTVKLANSSVDYTKLASGVLVNRNYATMGTWTTITNSQIPGDDTIPQQTEGYEIITCSITPKAATNILRVSVLVPWQNAAANKTFIAALFRDSTANAIAATWNDADASTNYNHQFAASVVAGSTAATTFKLRLGFAEATGTMYLNGGSSSRFFGGVMQVQMFIDEYNA